MIAPPPPPPDLRTPHALCAPARPGPGPDRPARPLTRPTWLRGVLVTEYYPVPERWFSGPLVRAPGLPGRHRADWLYSARGVTMEGDGVGRDGRRYHVAEVGAGGWVNRAGLRTWPCRAGGWSRGSPHRRALVPPPGVRFAPGPSRALSYYASVAVDPALIPLGSRVYIPAYRTIGRTRGWFRAADVGGAIIGRHLDVYRPPPAGPDGAGRRLEGQRVYVVPAAGDP